MDLSDRNRFFRRPTVFRHRAPRRLLSRRNLNSKGVLRPSKSERTPMYPINGFIRSEQVFQETYRFSPSSTEASFVTPEFELKGRTSSVEVRTDADVSNQWIYQIGTGFSGDLPFFAIEHRGVFCHAGI